MKTIQSMSKNTFGGINGFQKNKIGSVVGYKFRGEQVYRGYQKNVANPRTQAQTLGRTRFGNLSEVLREVSVAVDMGFGKISKGTKWSPRNYAFRVNYPRVFNGVVTAVDMEKLILSRGNVINPSIGELDFSTSRNVRIPINSSPYGNATNAKLSLVVLVYDHDYKEVAIGVSNLATDVQGLSANVSVPASMQGRGVLVYGFVYANQGDIEDENYGLIENGSCSDSMFLGGGTIE